MSEQHLIEEVARTFRAMSRRVRVRKIRKLAGESPADDRCIRKVFPDLYHEAFRKPRRRAAGARTVSGPPRRRAAKRR